MAGSREVRAEEAVVEGQLAVVSVAGVLAVVDVGTGVVVADTDQLHWDSCHANIYCTPSSPCSSVASSH